MSTLQTDIRLLVSRYGYKEVREGLEREMRETYEYLKGIYGNPVEEKSGGGEKSGVPESLQKSSEESGKVLEKKKGPSPKKSGKKTKLSGEAENLEKKSDRGDNIQESVESAGGKNVLIMTKASDNPEIRNVVIIDKLDTSEETEKSGIADNFTGEADSLDGGEKSDEAEKKSWPFLNKDPKPNDLLKTPAQRQRAVKAEILKKKEELKESGQSRKALLSKENLQAMIDEGLTYTGIGKKVGIMPITVKGHCERYGIKPKLNTNIEERKTCPSDYAYILSNEDEKKQRLEECRSFANNISTENITISESPCIYGIFRKSDKKCIYVGSTEDLIKRISMHKQKYDAGYKQHLFHVMNEQGGWDNHFFATLERRSSHEGLNIVESIWYEALKPVGNKINPMDT